jgi:thiol-disulfide isomerase/thioredoxin
MKHLFLVILFFASFFSLQAGGKLNLKIKIKNYADTSLLLTSYHGNKVKLIDTAFVTKSGYFIFEGENLLPGGIYMAVSPGKKKLFEFILDKDQRFSITTDTTNYALGVVVKGSENNRIFYDYLKFNEQQYQASKFLKEQLPSASDDSEERKIILSRIDSINKRLSDYKIKIIHAYPDLFAAKLFTAMREVEIPDSISGSNDSTLAYRYLKQHYWDYFDLSDARLLRTPLLSARVNRYFEQLVFVHPDSVIAAIDMVIGLARPSEEVVGYLVWHFVSVYQNPKYMGFEKVFIHLVDAYFSKETIVNTSPSVLQSLKERADVLRPLQLGEQAPYLSLIDTNNVFRSFREINSDYLVLLFWDYDCSFCKKEIKQLQQIYKSSPFDFEIFAINVNGDHDKWKKVVRERGIEQWVNVNGTLSQTPDFHDLYDVHGSPVIYLLDSKKRIIAKRIGADQIVPFLENYEKDAIAH